MTSFIVVIGFPRFISFPLLIGVPFLLFFMGYPRFSSAFPFLAQKSKVTIKNIPSHSKYHVMTVNNKTKIIYYNYLQIKSKQI